MNTELNQVIYDRVINVANKHNDIDAITLDKVSAICIEENSHIENEDVTMGKLYVDIARCFVTPTYDLPIENRDRLRVIAQSLGITDIVKMQMLNDVAFTQFYEECIENCLYSLDVTPEMYRELKSIQREYGLSFNKASEIERRITDNFVKSMITELNDDGSYKLMDKFVNTFVANLQFQISDSTKKYVLDIYNANSHKI